MSDMFMANGFDSALIGYTEIPLQGRVLVYDYDACVKILMTLDRMSDDAAIEFMEVEVVSAYLGEGTPLFVRPLADIDDLLYDDEHLTVD